MEERSELDGKLAALEEALGRTGGCVIAFSGGVDSSLLAVVAHRALGERSLAVTAVSASTPAEELASAKALAREQGFRHLIVESDEFANPAFRANTPERCYLCKRIRFSGLMEIARREGLGPVADGSNVDDLADFRPGERACDELGVIHPLRDAGLRKVEIRELSRRLGLPSAERPSAACLASRVPYHEPLDEAALGLIDRGEALLRSLGYRQVRIRVSGRGARIEVEPERVADLAANHRLEVARRMRALGFAHVALDLEGYRMGSLNEDLAPREDAEAPPEPIAPVEEQVPERPGREVGEDLRPERE